MVFTIALGVIWLVTGGFFVNRRLAQSTPPQRHNLMLKADRTGPVVAAACFGFCALIAPILEFQAALRRLI